MVDGYYGMEGYGPVFGAPRKWGVGVAGLNGLYVDVINTWMMGFNPADVGYSISSLKAKRTKFRCLLYKCCGN